MLGHICTMSYMVQLLTTVPSVQAGSGLRAAQARLVSTAGHGTRAGLCSSDSGHSQGWAEAASTCLHRKDFLFSLEAFSAVSTTANESDWWELVHVVFLSSALTWHAASAVSAEFFQVWNGCKKWTCHVIQEGEWTQASTAKSRRDIADIKPGCWETILNRLKKESSSEW